MIEVELPWPAREVWPNFRQSHHWRTYATPVANQRLNARTVTQMAYRKAVLGDGLLPTQALPLEGKIPVNVEFYPPDRRNRDDDGCIGAFKSARDGIADALAVDDKRFNAAYWFMEPEKPGKIVVRIG